MTVVHLFLKSFVRNEDSVDNFNSESLFESDASSLPESSCITELSIHSDSETDGCAEDIPLYDGASLTQRNFKGSFLALTQKHNLPSQAVDSILKLVKITLPKGNKCPPSLYQFNKSLSDVGYKYIRYTTCWNCQNVLSNGMTCQNYICQQHGMQSQGNDSSTFYVIDLLPELKRLITGKK